MVTSQNSSKQEQFSRNIDFGWEKVPLLPVYLRCPWREWSSAPLHRCSVSARANPRAAWLQRASISRPSAQSSDIPAPIDTISRLFTLKNSRETYRGNPSPSHIPTIFQHESSGKLVVCRNVKVQARNSTRAALAAAPPPSPTAAALACACGLCPTLFWLRSEVPITRSRGRLRGNDQAVLKEKDNKTETWSSHSLALRALVQQ